MLGTVRDHHLGAKLRGLRVSTTIQILSRDASWKAEVVFDSGARVGLAAGVAVFHNKNASPSEAA